MEDSLWAGLTDSHAGMPMGMTAENLADKVTLLWIYLTVRYSTIRYGTLPVGMPMGMTADNLADKVILISLTAQYGTVWYGTVPRFTVRCLLLRPSGTRGESNLPGGTLFVALKHSTVAASNIRRA